MFVARCFCLSNHASHHERNTQKNLSISRNFVISSLYLKTINILDDNVSLILTSLTKGSFKCLHML